MQVFLTLVRRELGSYFVSITGYAIISGVLFLMGLSYVLMLAALNGEPFDQPITEVFTTRGLFWQILLLASPLITMRSFAYERHTGTYEALMTAPVSDFDVVMAKFSGAMLFHMLIWSPLFAFPFILRHYSSEPIIVGGGPIATMILGIFLLGCLFMSMGCLASALTRSQVIAAVNAFAMGMLMFLLSYLSLLDFKGMDEHLMTAVSHISMLEHMRDFSRGIVDTRHVVFYLTLTTIFLYLNYKVVESRRWK